MRKEIQQCLSLLSDFNPLISFDHNFLLNKRWLDTQNLGRSMYMYDADYVAAWHKILEEQTHCDLNVCHFCGRWPCRTRLFKRSRRRSVRQNLREIYAGKLLCNMWRASVTLSCHGCRQFRLRCECRRSTTCSLCFCEKNDGPCCVICWIGAADREK